MLVDLNLSELKKKKFMLMTLSMMSDGVANVQQWIEACGVDINHANGRGHDAFTIAKDQGHDMIVDFLKQAMERQLALLLSYLR